MESCNNESIASRSSSKKSKCLCSNSIISSQVSTGKTQQQEQISSNCFSFVKAQTNVERIKSSKAKEKAAASPCYNIISKKVMVVASCNSGADSLDIPSASKPLHLSETCMVSTNIPRKTRLTLSEFHHPEQTVRLTESDPMHLLENKYDLCSPEGSGILGHGAFSTVRLGIRRSDRVKVAIKSIAKHEALRSRRLRRASKHHLEEWDILRRMHDHPNIIKMLDLFETDEDIHLVTEYCQGGELFDAIQKKRSQTTSARREQYSEPQAASIMNQILTALNDLHALNIVHKDIKPENILLMSSSDSDIRAMLCDFGTARLCRQEASADYSRSEGKVSPPISPTTSTPECRRAYSKSNFDYYTAPEGYYGDSYYMAADMYALGVTLYILLGSSPPIFSSDHMEVVFPEAHWTKISDEAKTLIKKMLSPDPATRITATVALQDKWINKNLEKLKVSNCHANFDNNPHKVVLDTALTPKLNLDLVRKKLCVAAQQKESQEQRSGGTIERKRKENFGKAKSNRKKRRECIIPRKNLNSVIVSNIPRNRVFLCLSGQATSSSIARVVTPR